jgi:undecaprenyl-diphosphatase
MDSSVYHSLNDFAYRHAWVGDLARFFAQDAVFILIGGFALLWLLRTGRGWRLDEGSRRAIFAGAVSVVLGLLIVQVIGHIWDRQRPFVVLHHFHKLIAHPADASFPSDHVTGSAALAIALALYGRRGMGTVAFIVAALIGVARVMVGVHWPTDILGAFGVGAIAAVCVILARIPVTWLNDRCSSVCARVFDALARVVRPGRHRTHA